MRALHIRYGSYLSGLDMLIAIAAMLPFIFLFAYFVYSGGSNLNVYIGNMLNGMSSDAKFQGVIAYNWPNAASLAQMLTNVLGKPYLVVKAPLFPSGIAPANVLRLTVIGGNVYYVGSGGNESTNIN